MGDVKVLQQDYHRNGSGGAGFLVSLVEWEGAETPDPRFVAITFFTDHEGEQTGEQRREYMREHTAVLNVAYLADNKIAMFGNPGNAWRGADYVGPAVAQAWQDNCRAGTAFGTVEHPSYRYDPFDDTWQAE